MSTDYITIPLSKTGKKHAGKHTAIVSIEDRELEQYAWIYAPDVHTEYAHRTKQTNGKKVTIKMHREIMARKLERELLPEEWVDHINMNGLDNRRENLRLATRSQNLTNQVNTSAINRGIKGYIGTLLLRSGQVKSGSIRNCIILDISIHPNWLLRHVAKSVMNYTVILPITAINPT